MFKLYWNPYGDRSLLLATKKKKEKFSKCKTNTGELKNFNNDRKNIIGRALRFIRIFLSIPLNGRWKIIRMLRCIRKKKIDRKHACTRSVRLKQRELDEHNLRKVQHYYIVVRIYYSFIQKAYTREYYLSYYCCCTTCTAHLQRLRVMVII